MLTKKLLSNGFLLLAMLFNPFASVLQKGTPVVARAYEQTGEWTGYTYDLLLTVHNNASASLPAGYSTRYALDTASLISQGRLLADCSDLRVTYQAGAAETELDRVVEGCGSASTLVWFSTQAAIAAGGEDPGYHLYYGNTSPGVAPANPNQVFAYYDDFEDGNADGWNAAKGTWSVVDEGANSLYRYSSGGANWAISYVPLAGVSDLEYLAKVRAAPSTSWIGLAFRIQDANNYLSFYQSLDVGEFKLARMVNDNHTILQHPAFSMPADTWYYLRVQAVGSQVRARLWPVGSTEPGGWTIQTTETAYQTQANIGLNLFNHTTSADWDDIQVRRLVENEPSVTSSWGTLPWWEEAWPYRRQVTVANGSTSASLPVGYSAQLSLDTAALVLAGQLQADCADLRITTFDGAANTQLDRIVEDCNTDHTRVWFALSRPVAPGGADNGTMLYYGNPASGAPPANGMNVFQFFEDWEQGTAHWTGSGGLDPAGTGTLGTSVISTEDAREGSSSQKFSEKHWGGDAFSGYIPVTPGTGYAIHVWARSQTNTAGLVGFDPYTSGYSKGTETWLWLHEWVVGPDWSFRSAGFTTAADTAYIKIKNEWWSEAAGTQPLYFDNLALRYALATEPVLGLGEVETTLAVPVIGAITTNSPVNLGAAVHVSAPISTSEGTLDAVTLRLVSPVAQDIPMSLASGTATDGVWEASYLPTVGGSHTFRILAHATTNRSALSAPQTFTVVDTQSPVLSDLAYTNPIFVHDTQTVTVVVTDNGLVSAVSLTVDGTAHPMTQQGTQWGYSWRVGAAGTIPFTITATDNVGNQGVLGGNFTAQPREVDVCTWKGCKAGAESWSVDDGSSSCKAELEAAGLRGTFYYNGASTPDWFATYTADGHEIASHTVGHPCNTPCCSPNCTIESLNQCPYTEADVTAYREGQLEPNIAAIEAGTGVPVQSLAWPCGCTDPGRMQAASNYYLSARAYYDYIANLTFVQDVNQPSPLNFYNLYSAASYNQTFIDRAVSEGKWAIITSHGSCDGIAYMGTRQDMLWAATVGEVTEYIYIRDHVQFSNYLRSGRTVSFDAVHTLSPLARPKVDGTSFDPIPFDDAVTLKVHILDTDTVLSVQVDGTTVPFSVKTVEGARYALFDTPLDAGRHVIVNLAAPAPEVGTVTDNSPVELGQAVQVTAAATVSEGTLQSVTLKVLTPQAADYPMSLVSGSTDTYQANFTPAQAGSYTYQVQATNNEGVSVLSTVHTLAVQDTTPPEWRMQAQSHDSLLAGETNVLSAEGRDLGGLQWAVLATDESGAWQELTYPASDWWDHDWGRRAAVTVSETAGLARSAETLDLAISSAQLTGLASCSAELRVADTSKNEVPVQVYGESSAGGVVSCRLLFQASVGANASRTYYIYYGNPAATAPSYTTDLTSSTAGGVVTVHNNYFDLGLDVGGGVISRLRLLQGSNTDLPISTQGNYYWGWHQVCSSVDGNITGKNNLCQGGGADASGLTLATTIDGPILKEYTFTSVKGAATYQIVYRFYAGSPQYGYELSRTGTGASVMSNFFYANGSYPRLGFGTGGTPAAYYNTYSDGSDQVRMASFAAVDVASLDGTNNDGTDLGGTEYTLPTASGLVAWVTTGTSQAEAQGELGRLAAPVGVVMGDEEAAPAGKYGSPVDLEGAAGWTAASFNWQNAAIPAGSPVQWRIKFCDLSGNCTTTDAKTFSVYNVSTDVSLAVTASPDPVFSGMPVTYHLMVTNSGPNGATGVQVTDVLPANTVFNAALSSPGCSKKGDTVSCDLGALDNGQTASVDLVITPNFTVSGELTNTLSVSSNQIDPNLANNTGTVTTQVDVQADLSVSVVDSTDPVRLGKTFNYAITVANHGPSNATGITLTAVLSSGMVVAQPAPSQGNCVVGAGNQVSCDLGSLAPSAQATVTLPVTPQAKGTASLSASVAGDQPDLVPGNNTDQESTTVRDWAYRAQITVSNTSASESLRTRYTAQFSLDTAALIAAGKMLDTCNDLRVLSAEGASQVEIDRVVEDCNTNHTRVWFALQRSIAPSATDSGYYVYYGDLIPDGVLSNGMNVFLYFEDFEQGAAHWTGAGGLDLGNTGTLGTSAISSEYSVSTANSQKFSTKKYGGDAYSGYIPVSANTGYAIQTWARSSTNNYALVGFDPYTASHVKGAELWLWTNDWTVGSDWAWRSGRFTTGSDTAFLKIKNEWWGDSPGNQPVFFDNLALRYSLSAEPTLTLGMVEVPQTAPSAVDDSFTTAEDTPLALPASGAGSPAANDTDPDGDPLAVSAVSNPVGGTAVLAGGSILFTPNTNLCGAGAGAFDYTVSDGQGGTDLGHVTVDLTCVNDAPQASPQSETTYQNTPLDLTLAGADVEGDPLTFAIVVGPAHGALSGTPPLVTYTPAAGYTGPDSFTFTVDDSVATSDPATVSLQVLGGTVPPLPSSFYGEVHLLDNPPAAGAALEAYLPGMAAPAAVSSLVANEADLVYTINVTGDLSDTPVKDGGVEGDAITFKIGGRVVATATWHTATNVRLDFHPPQALPGGPYSGYEGAPVSFSAAADDWGGDAAVYQWDWEDDGAYDQTGQALTHTWETAGTYTVGLKAIDGQGGEGTATTTVTVNNAAPVLTAITDKTVDELNPLSFIATATDSPHDTLTFSLVGAPAGAEIGAATGAFTWTPGEAQGPQSYTFTVKVCDSHSPALCAEQAFTVQVSEVNAAPVLDPIGAQAVDELAPLSFTAHAVDGDLPAQALTYSLANGAGGSVPTGATIDPATGAFTWTPTEAQGPASYTFSVCAGDGSLSACEAITVAVGEVNTAPVLTAIEDQGVAELSLLSFTAHAEDGDIPGDTLTYSLVGAPSGASIEPASGAFTWTPTEAQGPQAYTFDVCVSDGDANDCQTITVAVSEVNTAPVAQDQPVSTAEDTVLTGQVTATDADLPTPALTYAQVGSPAFGTLVFNGDGSFTYTPAADYTGPDSFTFKANDNQADSNLATVSITVTPVNDAPVITAGASQAVTMSEDGAPVAFSLTLHATDADPGDTFTWSIATPALNGTAAAAGTGASQVVTYAPDADWNGGDSFAVQVSDGSLVDTIIINLTVTAVNDAPVANPQTVVVTEDIAKAITLTGSDVDNVSLIYNVVDEPDHGTLSGTAPDLTYTPNTGYNGADSFTFTVSDGELVSAPATATIDVTAVNDAPAASDQAVGVTEDVAKAITLTGTDPENDALTFTVTSQPTHGTLGGAAPDLTYTPELNYNGADSFTFKASDGQADSNFATVSITVNAVNDEPVLAALGDKTTAELVLLSFTASASDVDGDDLAFSLQGAPAGAGIDPASGVFTWTPSEAQGPNAYPITVKVCDDQDPALCDEQTLTITVDEVNTAPVLGVITNQNVAELTLLSFTITATDADLPEQSLTYSLSGAPAGATIDPASGVFTWTPGEAQGPGEYTFNVCASDGPLVDCEPLTVTVSEVNIAPVIAEEDPQAVTMSEDGSPTAFSLTLHATDADGNPLTWSIATPSGHGTASADGTGGSQVVTYTPSANFNGSDSFTVQVADGQGGADTLTVNITIQAINDAPVCTILSLDTSEDTPVEAALPCTDADGDPLTLNLSSPPAHGNLALVAGKLVYTPALNANGADSFTFTVSDGVGGSSEPITVPLAVAAVNDPPVAADQSMATDEDIPKAITLTGSDVEADPLSYIVVDGPDHGALSGDAPNLTYTPQLNYNGSDSFTFKVNDGQADSDVAAVSITVGAVNDAPTAGPQALTTPEDTVLAITLTGSDPEGSSLSFTVADLPDHGALSGTAPDLTYTPELNYNGADSFTFQVGDGELQSSPATISITVAPVNDAPELNAIGPKTVNELNTLSFNASAVNVDGDSLTYSLANGAPAGAAITTGGAFAWTPDESQGGAGYTFDVCVTDGELSDCETITVTVSEVTVSHNIALVAGWNLVSFNVHPNDTAIASVLASLAGHYDLVYAWDSTGANAGSGNWMKFAPGAPAYQNTLTHLDEKMGFWIRMTTADTLELTGDAPAATTITLSTAAGGWNLVGYPSAVNGALPAALRDHGAGVDFNLVFAYHANDPADLWKLFDRTAPLWANDLTELTPGWGYWVYMTADHTWVVSYAQP